MSFPLSLSTTILLLLLTTTSHGYPLPSSIFPLQLAREIHLLRPRSGISGHHVEGLSCLSWRLGVETNNVIGWKTIPEECEGYVGNYMLGERYHLDSEVVIGEAMRYADGLKLAGDGKDVWVFDVDETTLSNLPYYAKHGFGLELFNATAFNKWVMEGKALVLPESLKLYKKVVAMGIKPVFLTGRTQDQTSVTGINLNNVGYNTWEKLILKSPIYSGNTSVWYKSSERGKLEKEGYRIVGNIGDQWSDLLGTSTGLRTFKLPDPMYYLS